MIGVKALETLRWLAQEGEDEFGYERELVHDRRVWMVGVKRIPEKVAIELLGYCCIRREDSGNDSLERYSINETGRDILADPVAGCKRIREILTRENAALLF